MPSCRKRTPPPPTSRQRHQRHAVPRRHDKQAQPGRRRHHANADIIDALGYGDTNTFEKAAATAPKSNADVKSLNRANGVDTNDNSADFTLSADITPEGTGEGSQPTPKPDPRPATATGEAEIAQIQAPPTPARVSARP